MSLIIKYFVRTLIYVKLMRYLIKYLFFSINKFNIFFFFYKDHGPKNCINLEKWIKETLRKSGENKK